MVNGVRKNERGVTNLTVDVGVGFDGAAAEIAQLPFVVDAEQDILGLNIAVGNRWLLQMHVEQALNYVRGDHEHFRLRQACRSLVRPRLDQVE